MPVLTWEGRELRAIELVPITLGWKDPRHRRGRPRLAEGEEARTILDRFATLSKPYGTTVDVEGASVVIPSAARDTLLSCLKDPSLRSG